MHAIIFDGEVTGLAVEACINKVMHLVVFWPETLNVLSLIHL